MGITKQYLRYNTAGKFNLIASPACNTTWVTLKNQEGRFIACGACEDIIIWDVNLVEKALVLPGEKTVVSCLACDPPGESLAAGFQDGSLKTFNLSTGEVNCIFSGHKQAITCLSYNNTGHQLASGSNDTHIVIWDIVAEKGLSRLTGHTGPVTSVHFMNDQKILISSSKDTSIKFWDLDTNYCFKTLLGHRTEVWGITLMRNQEFLVAGSGDSELRVWSLQSENPRDEINLVNGDNIINVEEVYDIMSPISAVKRGSILRTDTGRTSGLYNDPTGQVLAVHGSSGTLELFFFTSHFESLQRFKRREKKQRRLADKTKYEPASMFPTLRDIVKRLPMIKVRAKIKSVGLILGEKRELRVALTLNNNSVVIYGLDTSQKDILPLCKRKIVNHGHRLDVRVCCFSSDNLAIVTGSSDSIKVWNRNSLTCIRTIDTGYVSSLALVPGDRHVLAGCMDGKLLIVDLNTGEILEQIQAHEQEILSTSVAPDQRGCITGSSDKTVKFWNFDLIKDKNSSTTAKILSLVHTRTLNLDDSVLGVCATPNSKLLAVSLLDMTVKIFFMDSLKFFLSLYGHKMPVLCMDITSDSALIATGSADRNIKIWGLDFGDCHKSIFAHDGSVTGLKFVPNTHYFFSCGKDGKIKQWDADNFQKIITLEGHFGEASHLSVSPSGSYVISCGSDKVLRLITRSDEPLILEDQAEEERMAEEQNELATEVETTVKGQSSLLLPSRKTVNSEKGVEEILEGLNFCRDYSNRIEDFEKLLKSTKKKTVKPCRPPLMVAYKVDCCSDLILEILSRIPSSELEEALLLLPFPAVSQLLQLFPFILKQGVKIELITRVLIFLIKIHHGPIIGNETILETMKELSSLAFQQISNLRDVVGFNLYGLHYMQREIETKQESRLFKEATVQRRERVKKRKRKEEARKIAVLAVI